MNTISDVTTADAIRAVRKARQIFVYTQALGSDGRYVRVTKNEALEHLSMVAVWADQHTLYLNITHGGDRVFFEERAV